MTGGASRSINTALADPQIARPIVLLAQTPLDAVYAAGVDITETDEQFLRNIPAAVWTDLKAHILAAYTAGQTPTLNVVEGPAYRLNAKAPADGAVELDIVGPIPQDAGST